MREFCEPVIRETPILTGLYRYQAEGNQRSDDPFHCGLHEPAEEAPASFALSFQLAQFDDSETAERDGLCTCLKMAFVQVTLH